MNEEKGVYKPADEFAPSEDMLSRGMALQKTQTQYTTAIAVQRPRDIDAIQKAVLREAEYAGEDFYYSWTVKSKEGPKTIQGPSIGLTMSLAREWTNCAVDVNVEVAGGYDIFTASFVDIEKGFTVKRAFKQKRSAAPGRYDADRWEDMEFQKAQSKAIRNVIASGVPRWLVNQAVDRAKTAVLENISKEGIEHASTSAINFLGQFGVEEERIIERVGKPRNEWSTEDIAMLRGCASELKDGQASADNLFPPKKNGKTLEVDKSLREKLEDTGADIYKTNDEQETKPIDDAKPTPAVDEKEQHGGHLYSNDKGSSSDPGQDEPPPNEEKPLFDRIKAARPKAGDDARTAFLNLCENNQDVMIDTFNETMIEYTAQKYEAAKGKPLFKPDLEHDAPDQADIGTSDNSEGEPTDDDFDRAMKGYQAELGPPRFNRVLGRHDLKYFSEVKPEQRPMIMKAMSAELDQKQE